MTAKHEMAQMPKYCTYQHGTWNGQGVKSQMLNYVAHPRKKNLDTILSQGLRNPCFTKFSVVNFL